MNSEAAKPGQDPTKKSSSRTSKRSGMTIAAGLLIFCILVAGTFVFLFRDPLTTSLAKKPSQLAENEPISITPEHTGGITVVEKMPEREQIEVSQFPAPIAQGALAAQGYAIDLGSANSYLALSKRFANLVELNDSSSLNSLEPRVLLTETSTGLQARLLVGPIASFSDAQSTCESLKLPVGLGCKPSEFEGELIARSP